MFPVLYDDADRLVYSATSLVDQPFPAARRTLVATTSQPAAAHALFPRVGRAAHEPQWLRVHNPPLLVAQGFDRQKGDADFATVKRQRDLGVVAR